MLKNIILIGFMCLTSTVFAQKEEINKSIDNWHKSAATADEDAFFGFMIKGGIYIGTDKTERWTREEMYTLFLKYFQREKAWDFTPFDRDLHLIEGGKVAYFSESLNTWMGICRGSGVLTLTKEGWKLAQYHLSVTIDNDKVDDFLKLKPDEIKKKR